MQNPDRTRTNHNCGVSSGRFLAFDFDLCFSFLLPLIGRSNAWEISRLPFRTDHLFYRQLRGRELNHSRALDALKRLCPTYLDGAATWMPEEWNAFQEALQRHLQVLCEHLGDLEIQLAGSFI